MIFKSKLPKLLNLKGNYLSALIGVDLLSDSTDLHPSILSNCIKHHEVDLDDLMATQSLRYLDLSCNVISDEAAKSIADLITNNLEHLNLFNCKLLEDGFAVILEAAKRASKLNYINLEANKVSYILASEVAAGPALAFLRP